MTRRRFAVAALAAALLTTAACTTRPVAFPAQGNALQPLIYTIRFPQPISHTFTVDVVVPTEKRESVDLMMAIWSPGFYGLQNYADRVSSFTATAPDGVALEVTKPTPSRWTVKAGGRPSFTISYVVAAPRGSNLSNGVTETSAVIIGPASVHHARRKGASPSRSPARAARRLEGIDDVAQRVE